MSELVKSEAIQMCEEEAAIMMEVYKTKKIITDEDAEFAAEQIKEANDQVKKLKADQESKLEGLKSSMKRIKELYAPAINAAEKIKSILGEKLTAYQIEKQEKIDAENAKAADKHEKTLEKAVERSEALTDKGKHEEAQNVIDAAFSAPVQTKSATKIKGVSTRAPWVGELKASELNDFLIWVVDQGIADHKNIKIQKSWLNSLAKTYQNNKKIPGLRIYQDKKTIVR